MSIVLLAALIAAAVYAVHRFLRGYPPAPVHFRHLSRFEVAFIDAAADALFPPGGAVPQSGHDAKVPAYVDRYIASVSAETRILMRMLFFLCEHATFFLPAPGRGGRKRFSAMGPSQRVAVLEAWRTSRFFARRIVFTSLRAILTLGYFAHPGVLRQLSLAPLDFPSPVCEADLLYPRVGQRPETIRWSPADLSASDGTPLDPHGPLHPAYHGEHA